MTPMAPIWVVDDDRSIRWVLEKALGRAGLPCRLFENAAQVFEALERQTPQLLVSDIRMPGTQNQASGIELLQAVKTRYPQLPVIIMTAYSDLDSAVSSFQAGAFEYLPKPFDVDRAIELIRRALDDSRAGARLAPNATEAAPRAEDMPSHILGQAASMQEVFRAIGRLSHTAVTVLLTGETGTGKERVARALHEHSTRKDGPFIALNMAAIPQELMESELFGHERGAFTGATGLRRGRFEQAEGGTLFLDEIGDMPASLQTRLLRVLADGYFYRVGGHQPIKGHVRIIAATHQNLQARVQDGQFREDLYHRLNVIHLHLPPLRQRREDIGLLAKHFLEKSAGDLGVEVKRLAPETLRFLESLPFPGNVRELENLCHWLTALAPAQEIKINDLPQSLRQGVHEAATPASHAGDPSAERKPQGWQARLALEVQQRLLNAEPNIMDSLQDEFEKTIIAVALRHTHGGRRQAAAQLGIGRNTLTRKTQRLKL